VALLFALPSCVKQDAKTVLGRDGKGTATLSATFDLEKLNQIKEMMGGMMGGQPGAEGGVTTDATDEFDPAKLRKSLEGKKGVTLVSATKTEAEDKKSVTFRYEVKFESLEALYQAGLMGLGDGTKVTLEEKDGSWTLTADASAGAEGGAEMMGMMAPLFEGLEIVTTFELPGEIVATNGTKSDTGTSVTWKVDAKNMAKPEALKQSVTFRGEALALKAFSLTVVEKPATPPADPPAEKPVEKPPEAPEGDDEGDE
jgi:hypothetical protein